MNLPRHKAFLLTLVIFACLASWTAGARSPRAFPGFFKNVDYSRPEVFLQAGPQTKITKEITAAAAEINAADDFTMTAEIFRWMRRNLVYANGQKGFDHSAGYVLKYRKISGCTDNGLAFTVLCRAKGIPAVFVQTARMDWVEQLVKNPQGAEKIVGHILVEVYVEGEWHLVDSTTGKYFLDYKPEDPSLNDNYYVFAKSLDVWDTGVRDSRANSETMRRLFTGFDTGRYANPRYDYIDLMTGIRRSGGAAGNALAVASLAVLVGDRDTTQAFNRRFTAGLAQKKLCGLSLLTRDDAVGAARLILLITGAEESQVPGFLHEMVPEIKSSGTSVVLNFLREGRRIILIKAPDAAEIIRIIQKLPSDFLDRDYRAEPA